MNFVPFVSRRRLPVILQAEQSECGLACLAMVLNFHGHRIDINTLRARLGASQQGLTLKALMLLADRLALGARPLRLEPDELGKLQLPAVLHWDMSHYVVLKALRRGRAIVHDPAVGEVSHDAKAIAEHFTGVALELRPTSAFERKEETRRLRLRDLWSYSEGFGRSFMQLLVLSSLLQLFALALPFYTQLFIDDVLVNRDFNLLEVMALGFFLVTLVRALTELLRTHVVLHLSNQMSFQFATNVCRHLLHLPLAWFARRHPGDIVSRFGALHHVKDFLCSGIVEVLIDGVMVAGTLALMFVYSPPLTWVALIAVVVYGALRFGIYGTFRRRNEEMLHTGALESSNFLENLRAMQGIRLFGKEADRLAGWQNLYADVLNAGWRVQRLGISVKFAHSLLIGTENIVLMLMGGYAVLNNEISIGMIMAYIAFKDQFYGRVFALIDKMFEFRLLELHLSRLADIALHEQEPHQHGIGAPPPQVCLIGGLQTRDLGFRYHEQAPWLFRNVNLEVGNEEVVAIVGPTGCGKSTLLKVAMSLLQPEAGVVSLHGVPINVMGLEAFRERVAGVMQDDALLSGSIADNISFFDPAPDRERIEYVAHLAALADDIRVLPMQYNTLVGSMGAALSGGQVQRLLLARALYKRPRLLVLDEATSHLDVNTEKAVNKAIRQMKIARLIVAHRPDTILLADRILELTPEGLRPVTHAEVVERSRVARAA
ncbi:MAG: peptidase domain-containing ABC transporter [Pseudomonadota bacterium]|nr:peptidase domain-containing ABC transporter [Pseudomonadota bacterium]